MFANNLGYSTVLSTPGGAGTIKQVVTTARRGKVTTFYVKLVNPTGMQQSVRIAFRGVSRVDPTGTLTLLTGDPSTRNTLTSPNAIVPQTSEVSSTSRLVLPPSSVAVLRVTGR
jgi:alpha-L-arabinofuranosidase